MIRAIFSDRIERIGHHVVRVVNARWSDKRRSGIKAGNMDVYRQYDDGREAHDKVMREAANIKAAKLKKRQEKYTAAVKKFIGKTVEDGNIRVFVPESVEEISLQANVLHQCLVTANYIGKVIERKCLLVFLVLDGRPMATAEIAPNGKIVQFYADEDGEEVEQMKPTAEAQTVLAKWLKDFGKDAVKAMKKVA